MTRVTCLLLPDMVGMRQDIMTRLKKKYWNRCLWNLFRYRFLEHFAYANFTDDYRNLISFSTESIIKQWHITFSADRAITPLARSVREIAYQSSTIEDSNKECSLQCRRNVSRSTARITLFNRNYKIMQIKSPERMWIRINRCVILWTYVQRRSDCRRRM